MKSISRSAALLLLKEKISLFSLLFLIMRSSRQTSTSEKSPDGLWRLSEFDQRKWETHSYFKMFLIFQFKIMPTVYRKLLMPKPFFLIILDCYVLLSRIRVKLSLLCSFFLTYHMYQYDNLTVQLFYILSFYILYLHIFIFRVYWLLFFPYT